MLLLGRPGSGKSTALAWLLLQEAENALEEQQTKIPVLVELRYLSSEANESSVIEYNYDIAQTPLPPEDNPNPTTGNTYIFNDKVGQVVEKLTVQRDNIATQNNQKSAQDS